MLFWQQIAGGSKNAPGVPLLAASSAVVCCIIHAGELLSYQRRSRTRCPRLPAHRSRYSDRMNPRLAGLKAERLGRTAVSAVESAPNQLASVAAN
jgi:hypothetical protein